MCCLKKDKRLKIHNKFNNVVFNEYSYEGFNNIDEKESYFHFHIFKVCIALILFYIMIYKIIKYLGLIYN